MSEQTVEKVVEVEEDDNEPINYKPSTLNLVATLSGILSWVELVGFILIIVGQSLVLKEISQDAPLNTLLANASARNWMFSNLAVPLLIGLALFALLQGVAVGLNVLLEIDFNMREPKK